MRWGNDFPKDEGVGDWKSGEIRIGQSPTLGKTFFEFLRQENTKNDHFSLMQQRFTFPHDGEWKNDFRKTNLAFMWQVTSKNESESEPFMNFSCPAIWILHIFFGFPLWIVLSHVFSCLLVVFLNLISLNLILFLLIKRPIRFSFFGIFAAVGLALEMFRNS